VVRAVDWTRAHRAVIEGCLAKHAEQMQLCQA